MCEIGIGTVDKIKTQDNKSDDSPKTGLVKRTNSLPDTGGTENQYLSTNTLRPSLSVAQKNEVEDLIKNSSATNNAKMQDDFMDELLDSSEVSEVKKDDKTATVAKKKAEPKKEELNQSEPEPNNSLKINNWANDVKTDISVIQGAPEKNQNSINDKTGNLPKIFDTMKTNEADFSPALKNTKNELAKENKETHKFVDKELTRGMAHYQVVLEKYPQFKDSLDKGTILPKLNKKLKVILGPAITNEFTGAKAVNLIAEMPSIVNFSAKYDNNNPKDKAKLEAFSRKASELAKSSSPEVSTLGRELSNNLDGLKSADKQVRDDCLHAINGILAPGSKFLTEVKPKLMGDYTFTAELVKRGPVTSEKLYSNFMENVSVEKLMSDYPKMALNMKTVTDNFIKNLDLVYETLENNGDAIKGNIFDIMDSD